MVLPMLCCFCVLSVSHRIGVGGLTQYFFNSSTLQRAGREGLRYIENCRMVCLALIMRKGKGALLFSNRRRQPCDMPCYMFGSSLPV